ncbi:hypothetical protein SAY86_031561 [Trapa natans]|uniref:Uncharacterized protein n=1 Tax=Trapa natans TaxID=22666 RepID=A0AAN7R9U2_TRANT|nr:hypothetical protein SAY86_031561 [Trapa natans]
MIMLPVPYHDWVPDHVTVVGAATGSGSAEAGGCQAQTLGVEGWAVTPSGGITKGARDSASDDHVCRVAEAR